jgi:hypothetical protein
MHRLGTTGTSMRGWKGWRWDEAGQKGAEADRKACWLTAKCNQINVNNAEVVLHYQQHLENHKDIKAPNKNKKEKVQHEYENEYK